MEFEGNDREADVFDRATQIEQQHLEDLIKVNSQVKGPAPTGFCLDPFCEEQLVSDDALKHVLPADTPRFCGPECRDNWQKEEDRMKRRGYGD